MDAETFTPEPDTPEEIIRALADKLSTVYLFPDIGAGIAAHLQARLHAGAYADIDDGELLALAINADMHAVEFDEHLWVRCRPECVPEGHEALYLSPEWLAARKQEAEEAHFGFSKLGRLEGNIGLIEIRYFHRPEWARTAAAAAMYFVADTQALIFDLRMCPGGSPGMITLVESYLLGARPLHLGTIEWTDDGRTEAFWTRPETVERLYDTNKPIYVLVSRETFSGGEAFAYDLQARGRAVIVGEKTDGGAHAAGSYRIHPYYEASIPIGRSVHPITGTDWEKTGVVPDIAVQADQALETAHKLALDAILNHLGS